MTNEMAEVEQMMERWSESLAKMGCLFRAQIKTKLHYLGLHLCYFLSSL